MVDVLPPQLWTMNVLLTRKRSRLALDSDDDEDIREREIRQPSPALSAVSDTLKKTRTQCELDELDIVSPEHAWSVDVDSILSSDYQEAPSSGSLQAHSNRENFQKNQSIIILCVQGNLHLHYDLLCSVLPELYTLSPSLQAFVLCRDPSTHMPSTSAPFSLPLVRALAPNYNHFVRLGLLHPLGGGKLPLDALVVVDTKGRRRLVLPFGWGAGRHATTPAGRTIQAKLMGILRSCIETLAKE